VGVLDEIGKNTFAAVQSDGAERIARVAAASGVSKMVHISAIGANADSDSEYAKTKAEGEAGVLTHLPNALILRPSIIFGMEDGFFNRFAGMTRFGPILPIVGAETKFQPVYVDDVAAAAVMGVTGDVSGTYELGGPVVNLKSDNVVAQDAHGFDALGITPTAMETILPEYLWRFRPSGQYDAIKESAQNLKA